MIIWFVFLCLSRFYKFFRSDDKWVIVSVDVERTVWWWPRKMGGENLKGATCGHQSSNSFFEWSKNVKNKHIQFHRPNSIFSWFHVPDFSFRPRSTVSVSVAFLPLDPVRTSMTDGKQPQRLGFWGWPGPRYLGKFHHNLTVLPHHRWWFLIGESSPNGRTIQVL